MIHVQMGYGARETTPPNNTELGGYGYYLNRRTERVIDPLFARAVVMTHRDERFALVDVDIVQLSEPVVSAVAAALEERGYPRDHLLIAATHTHTAPVAGVLEGCGVQDQAYVDSLHEAILEAVHLAERDLSEVTGVEVSKAPAEGLAFNRTRADGPIDEWVRGAMYRRSEGAPIALIHYACHPVTLGRVEAVSADYPGRVVRQMQDRGVRAMFLNGFCGDIDPISNRIAWGSGTEETIDRTGRALADAFLSGLRPSSIGELRGARFPARIRNAALDETAIADQVAAVEARVGEEAPEARVARAWAEEMRSSIAGGRDLTEERFDVGVLKVGEVLVVALPYECFTDTALRLRAALQEKYTALVLGCFEQTLGYLPTEDEFEKGSYAALSSAYLYLRPPIAPGEAERLGDEIGRRVAEWSGR